MKIRRFPDHGKPLSDRALLRRSLRKPRPIISHARPISYSHLPQEAFNEVVSKKVVLYQFLYSLTGLILSFASILGGTILFFRGITGSTSWTMKLLGLENTITDAPPGAVLVGIGLFVLWATRYTVKSDAPLPPEPRDSGPRTEQEGE